MISDKRAWPPAGPLLSCDFGAATHPGKVRKANEDNFFVAPELGIFAVADGMGGHEAGALASQTVVESLASIGPAVSASDLLARLENRILRANSTLQDYAVAHRVTIGSTAAILLFYERHFACIWSGDSRIYLVRQSVITQLSRDHTEVRDLVERGLISPAEAKTWPRRNVITRAIGVKPEPELELEHGTLEAGDTFVICSDGLTGHVEDPEILAAALGRPCQASCDALIALTLERGAQDNVTVVVVRYEFADAAEDGADIPSSLGGEMAHAESGAAGGADEARR